MKVIFALIVFAFAGVSFAQMPIPDDEKKDYEVKKMVQVLPEFGVSLAAGDLAKRFSGITSLGLGLGYKSFANYTFNASISTLFGKKVNETGMLDFMKGSTKELLDANGNFASVNFVMRGTVAGFKVGRIINLERNKNNGLWLQAGFTYLTTHIKMEYQKDVLPQLDNKMYKGYDRYHGGAGFTGVIGYHHITSNRTISYFVNLSFTGISSRNLRGYQYDLQAFTASKSNDIMVGLNTGIILPIKAKGKGTDSFYH